MTTSATLRRAQIDQHLGELLHVAAAEARRGLVEQQHLGAGAIGQRDRQQALHAIGNVAGQLVVILRRRRRQIPEAATPPASPAGARSASRHGMNKRVRKAGGKVAHDRGDRVLQHRQFAEERILLEGAAQAAAREIDRS